VFRLKRLAFKHQYILRYLKNMAHDALAQSKQMNKPDLTVNTPDKPLADLSQALTERDVQIACFQQAISERDRHISEMTAVIDKMRQSLSWRITMPLRMLGRLLRGEFNVIGSLFEHYIATRKPDNPVRIIARIIGIICSTRHPFRLVGRKSRTLCALIWAGKFAVIVDIVKRGVRDVGPEPLAIESISKNDISILCTKHTLYIAHLIEHQLTQAGLSATVSLDYSRQADAGRLHIVICPQMFSRLPENFVAFQMEQSINPRWFSDAYFAILNQAISIFDYAVTNIEFLEKNGIQYQKLFYLPIGSFPGYAGFLQQKGYNLKNGAKKIDVLFYGDPKCSRRRQFLDRISEKYNLFIASEVFGEALVNLILSARVVINIHYYENALLETTRIYEVISLGVPVISEEGSDMANHSDLQGIAGFTPVGDIDAMLERIGQVLSNEQAYQQKIATIDAFVQSDKKFSCYFNRYLLANDLMSFDGYYQQVDFFPEMDEAIPRLCLTLTETVDRKQNFLGNQTYGFQAIEGIRHRKGWLGCGMSYKFMLRNLHDRGYSLAMICEDDVVFPDDFETRLNKIMAYLIANQQPWTLFSGLIAHLHPDTAVTKIEEVDGIEYIFINKTVSMVMNIYSLSAIDLLESWDQQNADPYTNTIDRHIESSKDLVVITTLPFLVGHGEELSSSLWGFENTQYSDMIKESECLLREKAEAFKARS